MERNYPTDRVFSFHRTQGGAEKVVEKAQRRAKAQLGSTGYTTLYSMPTDSALEKR
jgi:hypothetical protein